MENFLLGVQLVFGSNFRISDSENKTDVNVFTKVLTGVVGSAEARGCLLDGSNLTDFGGRLGGARPGGFLGWTTCLVVCTNVCTTCGRTFSESSKKSGFVIFAECQIAP